MSDIATETEAPAIYGALVRIQSEMGKIEKSGRGPNSQGSYPFMPVDAIVEKLGGLLTAHGVAVVPNQIACEQQLFRFPKVTPNGDVVQDGRPDAVQLITKLHYEFHFISATDGSRVIASSFGESIDTGDKGIRRAATAAYKEVLLRTFTVVAGEDDPDALDPNDQPAQVVHQNRGEQQRERAAAGKTARAPRAPRTPRGAAAAPVQNEGDGEGMDGVEPEVAAAEEGVAAPTPEAAAPTAAAQEPTGGAAETPAQRRERLAAARAAAKGAPAAEPVSDRTEGGREGQTPNEQRAEDWAPSEQDIADAETAAPAAPAAAPKAREAAAPVAKPEAVTKDDERYESVADIRKAIREALAARGLERDYVNDLGDEITGKPRGQWFANLNDLHKVLKAIVAAEVAVKDEDEAGF